MWSSENIKYFRVVSSHKIEAAALSRRRRPLTHAPECHFVSHLRLLV